MPAPANFDIASFLPYLLNRAAEESSAEFSHIYKDRYGLLRTEWRVLFHLGQHGEMTATDIGRVSKIHKTKVSRAVAALQKRRYLARAPNAQDRRVEFLTLTPQGTKVFAELAGVAAAYNAQLLAQFTPEEQATLLKSLRILMR